MGGFKKVVLKGVFRVENCSNMNPQDMKKYASCMFGRLVRFLDFFNSEANQFVVVMSVDTPTLQLLGSSRHASYEMAMRGAFVELLEEMKYNVLHGTPSVVSKLDWYRTECQAFSREMNNEYEDVSMSDYTKDNQLELAFNANIQRLPNLLNYSVLVKNHLMKELFAHGQLSKIDSFPDERQKIGVLLCCIRKMGPKAMGKLIQVLKEINNTEALSLLDV